jgi:hypothetical protein
MSEPRYPCTHHRFSTGTERRLEEIRQILREAEPFAPPSALQGLDAEAIEDRRVFKRRFGHDWPLRFHREALVRLRQERDWTDGEVKLFLYSGALRRGPFGVAPDASVWFAVFGGVLAAMMLLFASIGILFIIRSASLSFEIVARGGAVTFALVAVAWMAYQLYIRPWRIQRR